METRIRIAFIVVQVSILISLLWKCAYFYDSFGFYHRYAIDDPFFPDFFRSANVLAIAYVICVLCLLVNLYATGRMRVCSALGSWLAITIPLLHQGSYNDVTFLTAWWGTLWSTWLAARLASQDCASMDAERASQLACLIIAMMFLGGAVGKWTSEYWSGEVLYQIYFKKRDYWTFAWVRSNLPDRLPEIAMYYSRMIIVIESMLGLLFWLVPRRIAGWLFLAALIGIPALSNLNLISVIGSLIGLAIANQILCWNQPPNDDSAESVVGS